MKLKIFILCLLLSFPFLLINAQNQTILRADGKIMKPGETPGVLSREIQPLFQKNNPNSVVFKKRSYNTIDGTIDTISWGVPPSVNFGFFGQDRMVQWFEAPADMRIIAAGYNTAAVDVEGTQAELKLVTVNWTKDQIMNAGVTYWGYYPAVGNGYNDATAFLDDLDRTGDWVDMSGTGTTEIFGHDLWSSAGIGAPTIPVADGAYQFIQMNLLGFEPMVNQGDIIGVVMKHAGHTMDADRIGFMADNTLGIPGFKYYANGRVDPPNDHGWWSRAYTWDFALVVELTGDIAPSIENVTDLATTLSQDARTVEATITDINPSGGPAGVFAAYIMYSIDGGATWNQVNMVANGDVYSANIPGMASGTHVDYYLLATDVQGNQSQSKMYGYDIFGPTATSLLVFNGFDKPDGYPQSYYFGHDDFTNYSVIDWYHDVWAYGPLTNELLNYYTNVFEIATNGPNDINSDAIRAWLEADGTRNYFLAGDEWFGAQSGWPASLDHAAGDFHYDILGVATEYNDINYAASDDINLPSIVLPIGGTLIGDSLATLFASIGDTMWYYPRYEIDQPNWLDGADFEPDVEVFMTATGADGNTYSIGGSRVLPNGNKIVVCLFDPLSLDAPSNQYYWYGFSSTAPQVQALRWFGNSMQQSGVPVSLPSFTAKCGSNVNIPITVDSISNENVIAYQFKFHYDPAALYPLSGDSLIDRTGTVTPGSWQVLANNDSQNGVISIAAAGTSPITSDGELLKLNFKTRDLEGEYPISLSNVILNNGNPRAIVNNGSVNIYCLVCGDADEDGNVLAYDAALTLQQAIDLIQLSQQGKRNADVDMDGFVRAFDAALILRHTISLPEPVETCFDQGVPKQTIPDIESIDFEVLAQSIEELKDKNRIILAFDGFTHEDGVISLEMEIETDNGVELSFEKSSSEFITGINKTNDNIYKIAVASGDAIDAKELKLRLDIPKEIHGSIYIKNIRINNIEKKSVNIPDLVNSLNVKEYDLVGNYPNPFNPSTNIVFQTPEKQIVKLTVYDILGRKVKELANREFMKGRHKVEWNGTNSAGSKLSSGNYIVVMHAGNFTKSMKINLLK